MILPGGNPNYSVFDRRNRSLLQKMILDGEVDSDTLLPDVLDYIETNYYNLFCNLDTGKHSASPYAVGESSTRPKTGGQEGSLEKSASEFHDILRLPRFNVFPSVLPHTDNRS